jgi:hypothetical protein
MDFIFKIVFVLLMLIADMTGLSYEAINIIVYYIVIPFVFIYMIDLIIKKHYLKIGFAIFVLVSLLLIDNFEKFSKHLFDLSVIFLNWFKIIGLDYLMASVVICVLIPFIVFIFLLYLINKERIDTYITNFKKNGFN